MLYSFKEQFVPMVKDGSKRQTVRAYRKDGQLPKVGALVHCYFGLRTKHSYRLIEPLPCTKVHTIFIFPTGTMVISQLLEKFIVEDYRSGDEQMLKDAHYKSLSDIGKDCFAWDDGFRPDGTTSSDPTGSFDLMLRFFKQTHDFPFIGTVTYW